MAHLTEPVRSALPRAARIAQIVVGAVFLVAGASKIWDPVLFFWHTLPYTELAGLIDELGLSIARAALLLGPLEFSLGLALLVNWRPKAVCAASFVLLLFFFGLTFFAWRRGLDASCGCFGALVQRGPGEAALENLVLIGLLVFAWWKAGLSDRPVGIAGKYLVLGGATLALLIGGLRFFPEAHRIEASDLQVGVNLSDLKLEGVDLDLGKGPYLVELFSPTCSRCANVVPGLNTLENLPGLPPVIALTFLDHNSELVQFFVDQYRPQYGIATISRIDFVRLTWRHGFPRLAFVRDGIVQRVWEAYEHPTRSELEALSRNPSGSR